MSQPPEAARCRLDDVFGDVLPATTSDERDERDDGPTPPARDEELLANLPPHHEAR